MKSGKSSLNRAVPNREGSTRVLVESSRHRRYASILSRSSLTTADDTGCRCGHGDAHCPRGSG